MSLHYFAVHEFFMTFMKTWLEHSQPLTASITWQTSHDQPQNTNLASEAYIFAKTG